MSAPDPPQFGASACPRCGAPLHADQDWCLECGAPARTRLAPTPNWHIPAAILAVVVALAGVALAAAFVELTEDAPRTAATTASAAPPEGVAPSAQTTPPVTSPVATTPAPTTLPTTATVPPATVPGQTATAPAASATTTATSPQEE